MRVQMMAKDRLIFPLDVPNNEEARKYVTLLGPHVGVFKIGLELFVSEGPAVVETAADLTDAGIFLDLKFHDIPATVQRAIRSASYLSRTDFVTVHCDQGRSLLETIVDEVSVYTKVLAVTVLTSLDTSDLLALGIQPEFAEDPVQLVLRKAVIAKAAGCSGVVCSGREVSAVKREFGGDLIVVTPGIRPAWGEVKEDDQKRVVTPYSAIKNGADYIVVGRPIRTASDPVEAAARVVEEIEQGLRDRQQ
ncbi:MAG: orotidine-5'-phosphate decarboxylase [Deltaproteobacteria bacterium]|nr:MAG: orotidine-5'-phosphate decarboxylase [Deltaproteobacteria bacterium]